MIYNNLSGYLKNKYHGSIRKICIDGGFTCPNRDGTCGRGGCVFCGERGSGEHIVNANCSISEQVRNYFSRPQKAEGYIVYFQNFTNTYAPVETLRERYNAALIDSRIVILSVGTRPDCITEEIADLLCEYRDKGYEVWVELGLQTANDATGKIINRGYDVNCFEEALTILSKKSIPIVVHLIIGLPGESIADVKNTVNYINRFEIWGIKIHSIYVMKNTKLETMFLSGEFLPLSFDEYIDSAIYVLTHISPKMIVHRITGDCPPGLLVAPDWNRDKNAVINEIQKRMVQNDLFQGCMFEVGDN